MSELTNKELASALLQIYTESDSMWARKRLELAAERLAQYPDMHHTEATNFRDLANKFLNMRDQRNDLLSFVKDIADQGGFNGAAAKLILEQQSSESDK